MLSLLRLYVLHALYHVLQKCLSESQYDHFVPWLCSSPALCTTFTCPRMRPMMHCFAPGFTWRRVKTTLSGLRCQTRSAVLSTQHCLSKISLNDQSEGTVEVEGKVSGLDLVFGGEPWTSALPVCSNRAKYVQDYPCNQAFLVSVPTLAADRDSRMNGSQCGG